MFSGWYPTDLTQKPICLYWERYHLAHNIVLRYTINGTEWLPRMPSGLVPMVAIIRQTLICPSWALSYNTQLVFKDNIIYFCISAYRKSQKYNHTPLIITVLSQQPSYGAWWFVSSTEIEPRTLHCTDKTLPLNYILSLKLQISNEWETVTINKDHYVTSTIQRITYQNEYFLIEKETIQKKKKNSISFLTAVEQDSRLSYRPPKHREGIFLMVLQWQS